jgi:asparagine synthase (glutamine-hydrolysing)
MCGLTGFLDLDHQRPVDRAVLARMTAALAHRGPDAEGYFVEAGIGLGFRRLRIIDLETGDQPLYNEDRSLVLACNGEILNHRALRRALIERGHAFATGSDVEVLLHLYEERGLGLLDQLNGQFAFALWDRRRRTLLLARDRFGIAPLHYTTAGGQLIFGSEIKAILEHPLAPRAVDLTGLDQVLSFPGLVSPRTMFKDILSLAPGHYLRVSDAAVEEGEYWDLVYPELGQEAGCQPETWYVERLGELLAGAVDRTLQADVPVGCYVSGGLDSSLVAALVHKVSPGDGRQTFGIAFTDEELSEAPYQRVLAAALQQQHHEIVFDTDAVAGRLRQMVLHCECPVKETYNTCALALSAAARGAGITVVLSGEGADELFAGYPGYRAVAGSELDAILEGEISQRLWGDSELFYEQDQHRLREVKAALYSAAVNERFGEFDCLNFAVVNPDRLRNRHRVHQRSYLDCKLRLADHLLGDHGDRMLLAHGVEGRYPFLDAELVEFSIGVPPHLKINRYTEKYILRRVGAGLLPGQLAAREKLGFRSPTAPQLLCRHRGWMDDLLSPERIARQGYFDATFVERLRQRSSRPGFRLDPYLENDLLLVVLTFNLLLELFGLPDFS